MKSFFNLIALTALAVACGNPNAAKMGQGKDADSERSETGAQTLDAQAEEAPKTKAKKKAKAERPAELAECPAVAAHEGMEGCDSDDLDTQAAADDAQQAADDAPNDDGVTPTATETATSTGTGTGTDTANKDPNVVEFRIKAGTDKKPWNAQAEMVVAKVGQTVRIINDDTVPHRLHTNGAPCPHGQNFAAGASFDCVATKAFDPVARGALYDHNAGETAQFWLMVTP